MKIVVADDHSLFADALKIMFEKLSPESDIILVNSVSAVEKRLREEQSPDMVILDLKMPDINGIEGLKSIKAKHRDLPVAIMSGLATRDDVHACMAAGADGFFPKTLSGQALVSAVNLVLTGEKFMPHNETANAAYNFNKKQMKQNKSGPTPGGRDIHLTPREYEVMKYLLKGASNKLIARGLDISVVTVKLHVKNICQKLNAKNRTQAALFATDLGLVKERDM